MKTRTKKPVKKSVKKKVVKSKAPEAKKGPNVNPILRDIIKAFGSEAIFDKNMRVEVIPSRLIGLNWVLARGGFVRGRVIELSGKESSGKSTMTFHAISCSQATGGLCGYVAVDDIPDIEYMQCCGVDTDALLILQPEYGEDALSMVERLVRSNKFDIVVLDSIAAMIPKAELEAEMTDQQVGLLARIMSKALKKLRTALKGSKTCVIMLNELRDKFGGGWGFGPQTDTPGGRALKHAASVRLFLQPTMPIKVGANKIGFMVRVKCLKNKTGAPGREVEIPIIHGRGVDERIDFINLAVRTKVIQKRKSIYTIRDRVLGNGWLEAYTKINRSPKLKARLSEMIMSVMNKRANVEDILRRMKTQEAEE